MSMLLELIIVLSVAAGSWALFTGNHIYFTNHLAHIIFPKKIADEITRFFKSLP